jgi:eukaryotic-like serine/threonine-protein kinase
MHTNMHAHHDTHEAFSRLRGVPHPGDVIGGKYLVESPCRRGGIALELTAVPANVQPTSAARVDIRLLPPEWCGDPGVVERFLHDGQAAAPLTNEHAVRVFGVGTMDGGAPYFVLEHLEGSSLDELVAAWGSVPVATAVDWILQAAEALAEAHARGVVHRRLRTSSLVLALQSDGLRTIKVRDFGLSRVVDAFSGYADSSVENAAYADRRLALDPDPLRSVPYLAPEQLRAGCAIDSRADIWALGVVLYELIAGQPPFAGETVPAVCHSILTAEAPHLSAIRPNVPGSIDRAVRGCLQRDPDQRFADVAALAHTLAGSGTALARTSCERIDRLLRDDRSSNDPIPLVSRPVTAHGTVRMRAPDTVGRHDVIDHREVGDVREIADGDVTDGNVVEPIFRAPASGRIVALALLMLCALGAATFAGLYQWVHGTHSAAEPALVAPPVQ